MEREHNRHFEQDLNLNFEDYASVFTEHYVEDSFTVYNTQAILESAPTAIEVKEDLETLVNEDLLEKDNSSGSSKLPDLYRIKKLEKISSHPLPDNTKRIVENDEEYAIERFDNRIAIQGPEGITTVPYMSREIAENTFFNIETVDDIPGL